MICLLAQFLPLIAFGYWMWRRGAGSRPPIVAAPCEPRAAAAGWIAAVPDQPDVADQPDDADQPNAWTALDERELIRLLSENAPRPRPAANGVDDTGPQI